MGSLLINFETAEKADEVLWQFCPQSQCQNECSHCMAKFASQKERSLKDKIKILDSLLNLPYRKIALTGGEPLMHTDIISLAIHISQRRRKSSQLPMILICTNGKTFDERVFFAISKANIVVRLSLHTFNSRPQLAGQSEKEALEILQLCTRLNIRVIVNTLVFSDFNLELPIFLNLLRKTNVIERWNLNPPYVTQDFSVLSPLYPKAPDLVAASKLHGLKIGKTKIVVSKLLRTYQLDFCRACKYIIYINTQGQLCKCLCQPDKFTKADILTVPFRTLIDNAMQMVNGCSHLQRDLVFKDEHWKCALFSKST